MNYRLLGIFLLSFTLCTKLIGATERDFSQKNKRYTLSVCAVVKNEANYLKEWIEFHRIIGVDHFYLYNNNSTDLLEAALKSYIRKGIVTLINWPDFLKSNEEQDRYWPLSTQIPAYENAIKFRAIKTTKWLALLNTDEYLVPVNSYSIKELLNQYDSYPAIILTTDVFDGSNVNLFPQKKLLIESRDLIKSPDQGSIRRFTKIILKPQLCEGFDWAPYKVLFKNDQHPIALKKSDMRVNCYANRDKLFIDTLKHRLYLDTKEMPASEISALLDQGYSIEDQEQIIFRYLPELQRQCLGGNP